MAKMPQRVRLYVTGLRALIFLFKSSQPRFPSIFSRNWVLVVVCLVSVLSPSTSFAQQGSFAPVANFPNSGFVTATTLNNGQVLLQTAALNNDPALVYDPATGAFTSVGSTAIVPVVALLLKNGLVFSTDTRNGSLYDPASDSFTATPAVPNAPGLGITATLLNNGQVLLAGGGGYFIQGFFPGLSTLFDPTTGTFLTPGSFGWGLDGSAAALLSNGTVLFTGGYSSGGLQHPGLPSQAGALLYDPVLQAPVNTANGMSIPRAVHTATTLNNGMVLIVGGSDANGDARAEAELYDPATKLFTLTGSMAVPRAAHSATLLRNGKVLIAGGYNGTSTALASAELYDPRTGSFSPAGNMSAGRTNPIATMLDNGTVLVIGGNDGSTGNNHLVSGDLFELVSLLPGNLAFSNQVVNKNSPAQTVVLTNDLDSALTGVSVAISGANISDFQQNNNCPATIPAGGTCTITVSFTPPALGSRTATLTVASSLSATSPLVVPLSGTGVAPFPIVSLSSNGLNFATQPTGTPSSPQTVTLTNAGTAALQIQTLAIAGANASEFTLIGASTCTNGVSVAVNASCTIQVKFTPSGTGNRTAAVTIIDNANDSPEMISLSGNGPTIAAAPSTVTFTSQYVGTTSLPQTVTVSNQNTDAESVTVTSVTASPGDFGVLNNCINPLGAGFSCTIGVFFNPSTGGTRTGTLTITTNDGAKTQVALSGPGLDFTMTPGSASSATITAGQTATYSIAVAPAGGFAQSVSLTCGGGPTGSTCSVSPGTLALSGSAAQTAKVTVTTTAQGSSPSIISRPSNKNFLAPLIFALARTFLFSMIVASLGTLIRRRGNRPRWAPAFALALIVTVCLGLASCGGGSNKNGGGNTSPQAGTYTVTVSGTFSAGSTSLTHNTKLTLVVQ
jgi:hypothetical protein